MSVCLSRGASESERVTALMYEGLHSLCFRCVILEQCACVAVFLCIQICKIKVSSCHCVEITSA